MQQQLKDEIRRCQFLQIVYCDFGSDWEESNDRLTEDISAALIALDGTESEQMAALNNLQNWV